MAERVVTQAPGYRVRLARHDELARLPDLQVCTNDLFASQAAELGLEPVASVVSIDTLARANLDGRVWVAADPASVPVGFALVIELGLFAHLEELYVLPEHGRKGLGSALLESVCEWAFTRGFSAVTLSAFREGQWNAPFYAQRGFAVVDPAEQPPELMRIVEMERRKGQRTDLRVIMQREV
jgi:GNAT superfamily N-acetyltransferase